MNIADPTGYKVLTFTQHVEVLVRPQDDLGEVIESTRDIFFPNPYWNPQENFVVSVSEATHYERPATLANIEEGLKYVGEEA